MNCLEKNNNKIIIVVENSDELYLAVSKVYFHHILVLFPAGVILHL